MIRLDSEDEPMRDPANPDVIVTLIHGTFAQRAAWVRTGSALRARLESAFGNHVAFQQFTWSGDNTVYARIDAGHELAEHVKRIRAAHPGARQILIAHSHGGNVALYALRYLRADANVVGVACIATPFVHANLRDIRVFDGNTLQGAFFGLLSLGLYLIASFLGIEVASVAGLIFVVAGLIIASVISALLGGFLAGAIEGLRDVASALAEAIDCRLESSTNLFIVRKVGDEASLALGGGQLFFWTTSKAFAHLATKERLPIFRCTGRPLPKVIRALWWIALAGFVADFGWILITAFQDGPPKESGALFEPSGLVKLSLDLAMVATMVVKLTGFEHWLFGATLLGLAGTASLVNFAFGTSPSVEAMTVEEIGSFRRWLGGTLLALLIEINTEATPAGRWIIRQFERTDDDRRADCNVLVHSAYEDPCVIDNLIQWLAASTDLRDGRVDHAT